MMGVKRFGTVPGPFFSTLSEKYALHIRDILGGAEMTIILGDNDSRILTAP